MGCLKQIVFFKIGFILIISFFSCKEVQITTKEIKSKNNEELTLKKIWKNSLLIHTNSKVIKMHPVPFVFNDSIVFNTTRGCIFYSLKLKQIIKFFSGLQYIAKDIKSQRAYIVNNKQILSISLTNNKILWTISNPIAKFDYAACNDKILLLTDEQLRMYAFQSLDGKLLWKNDKPDPVISLQKTYPQQLELDEIYYNRIIPYKKISIPFFSHNKIIIGTKNGYLVSYSIKTGKKQWQFNVKNPASRTIIASNKYIFVGIATGILVINNDDGSIKKNIILGTILDKDTDPRYRTKIKKIKYPRVTCMDRLGNNIYTYCSSGSIITAINIDSLKINWSITHYYTGVCGCKYFNGMSISLDRIWIAPIGPMPYDSYFFGINITNLRSPLVKFSKERVLDLQELRLYGETNPQLDYYKKLPMLEWNKQLILVDESDITAYEIIPKYKKVGDTWIENK